MANEWKRTVRSAVWRSAEDMFQKINPGCLGLLPDQVLQGLEPADVLSYPIDLKIPEDSGNGDLEIAEQVWSRVQRPSGGFVVVITDAMWQNGSPVVVSGARLDDLISEHGTIYNDAAFAGDVLLADLEASRIIVVSHEGQVFEHWAQPT